MFGSNPASLQARFMMAWSWVRLEVIIMGSSLSSFREMDLRLARGWVSETASTRWSRRRGMAVNFVSSRRSSYKMPMLQLPEARESYTSQLLR